MVSPDDVAGMVAFLLSDAGAEHLRPVARGRRQCRSALRWPEKSQSSARASSAGPGRSPSPAPATRSRSGTRSRTRRRRRIGFIRDVLADLAPNDLLNGQHAGRPCSPHLGRGRPRGGARRRRPCPGEHAGGSSRSRRAIFAELDALRRPRPCSSSLDLGDPALDASPKACKGRRRCLVVHPINPPYLIPAAEVVPAPWTDARDGGTHPRAS